MTLKRYVIEIRSDDEFRWLAANSGEFGKLINEGEKVFRSFPLLLQDIFYALYREEPQMLPFGRLTAGARFNRLVMEQLMKNNEFKKTRSFTRQNLPGSAMVAMYFAGLILYGLDSRITDTVNEIYCSEEELEDALLQKKVVDKIAGIAAGTWQDLATRYEKSSTLWAAIAEEKRKNLRTLAAQLNMLWNTSGHRHTAISGTGEEGQRKGRFETGAEGFGANRGVWARGDLANHLQLVDSCRNSPKLKRLAERLGRLKEIRSRRKGRMEPGEAAEINGIDFGDDLTLVVPEEWVNYFHPRRRLAFKKKYADEALCLYDFKGKRPKGKGCMVICLDNSGSMQGTKEETAKAIALALMETAASQKRDFVVIMFGGPEDEMKVFEIPKGRCTTEQLLEIGEFFLCSAGTDFAKPLQEAVRFLEKDTYRDGDIVFVTDGVCNVSPGFLEWFNTQKKVMGFRTIAVLVNYGKVPTVQVESFSDELLMSRDFKGLDVAPELFDILGS